MKQYEVSLNITLGYIAVVSAESEEDAAELAQEAAAEELSQGLGFDATVLGIKETGEKQ